MEIRPLSGALLATATLMAGAMAFAQTQTGPNAQASGQAAATADRSGASAQGSTAGAAHTDDASAALASGSSVNAVLAKPVDSGRSKPGDPVTARTTQPAKTQSGTSIPKDSELVGHVSEAHTRGDGQAASSLGIVFDKAVTKDRREIPLSNVAIQAVAAARASTESGVADTRIMSEPGGGMAPGRGGGGLIGRTTGTVGATAGSGLGAVASGAGALAAGGSGVLQAGPGAVGGVDATGLLTTGSTGVFGLHGLNLSAGSDATAGSVITSNAKRVHLDQGTRLLLSSQSAASAHGPTPRSGPAPRPADGAKPADSKGTSKGTSPNQR